MRIKGVQCDALLSVPVFIANSNRSSLGKLFCTSNCNVLQHVRVFVKSEDRVVPQNYTQVISHTHTHTHTHTCSCISTSIVVFLNWFGLSQTWAQKCTKQAPPSNLILWGAFDTVERRDGSSLRARSLVGTENASQREEWDEEKSLFLAPFFSPSPFCVFLCLKVLTSEPARRLGWLHQCNPGLDSRSRCHSMA